MSVPATWARVWTTLAAAKEALKAEVFSLDEHQVDVNRQGSVGDVRHRNISGVRSWPTRHYLAPLVADDFHLEVSGQDN